MAEIPSLKLNELPCLNKVERHLLIITYNDPPDFR